MNYLIFFIGLFIGSIGGFVLAALMSMANDRDDGRPYKKSLD